MFYLLKNNRIIDTNDKTFKEQYTTVSGITYYSIETPNETHHHFCFGGGEYEDNIYTFGSREIKKQSEKIYDLIDWGKDLIGVDDNIFHCKYFDVFLKNEYLNNRWFNAIYKPNSKGDYIKVWEKKE